MLNLDRGQFLKKYNNTYLTLKEIKPVTKIYKAIKLDKYIFSNSNPLHAEYIKKEFSHIVKLAKEAYFTPEIKFRKGDINSFKYILGKIKLKPKEILFIDNGEKYTNLAETLGINTILYKNVEQLKKELIEYGIKL